MGCLSDNQIWSFARRESAGAARDAASGHIAACSDCRRLVAEALLYALDEEAPPAGTAEPPADSPRLLGPGARVSRFEVVEVLGVGASGVVYRARDPQLERQVALKLLRPDIAATSLADQWRQQFLFEAKAMARLAHPNVVVVFDAGALPDGGEAFIAMELVEGASLSRWLEGEGRSLAEVLELFVQVARGLAAAHAVGLVHGDFKPDNVLLGPDGRPRITDFGLARSVAGPAPVVGGTPLYMAPESLERGTVDARSDQFSFCVALFMALYGRHPYAAIGKTPLDLPAAVLRGELHQPPSFHAVPSEILGVLARGLSPAAADRHPSMDALADALRVARRRGRRRVLGQRMLLASGAALLGMLLGAGILRAVEAPRCGDGTVHAGEECDDGNRSDADGCVACRFARCGDGHLRAIVEECDDGNARDGDGCSSTCVACGPKPCASAGWIVRQGSSHAYRIFPDAATWDGARERCARWRAHLATLEDEGEHAFVATWAKGPVWIGASDRQREGKMIWVTGKPVTESRFGLGEPDDPAGDADCVALDGDGRWHDRRCDATYAFMCEIE